MNDAKREEAMDEKERITERESLSVSACSGERETIRNLRRHKKLSGNNSTIQICCLKGIIMDIQFTS